MLPNSPTIKKGDSFQSEESEFDEEDMLKHGIENNKKIKRLTLDVYNKYLNLILVTSGDRYVQERFKAYLRAKRKGRREKKRNFFQRMEEDVKQRLEQKQRSQQSGSPNKLKP